MLCLFKGQNWFPSLPLQKRLWGTKDTLWIILTGWTSFYFEDGEKALVKLLARQYQASNHPQMDDTYVMFFMHKHIGGTHVPLILTRNTPLLLWLRHASAILTSLADPGWCTQRFHDFFGLQPRIWGWVGNENCWKHPCEPSSFELPQQNSSSQLVSDCLQACCCGCSTTCIDQCKVISTMAQMHHPIETIRKYRTTVKHQQENMTLERLAFHDKSHVCRGMSS